MVTSDKSLGGRLPLLKPDSLSSGQEKLYDQLKATMVPWAKHAGFKAETDEEELIGPFNPMLRSPEIATALMGVTQTEQQHTSLSAKVREVVILTTGAVWQAAYELYAHTAVAEKAGFDDATIQALVAGQKPDGLSEKEALAYDFTYSLVATHQVNPDLYRRVLEAFEEKGMVDMIALLGQYMTISAVLNTFAVPVPAE